MKKAQLTTIYSQPKKISSKITLFKESLKIKNQWLNSCYAHFNHYHIYLPIIKKREINTYLLLTDLWQRGKKTYISKIIDNHIEHYEINQETLYERNSLGILEPINASRIDEDTLKDIEAILVPVLPTKQRGYYIDREHAWYESCLAQLKFATTIGLSAFPIINNAKNIQSNRSINAVITPHEIYTYD